LNRSRHAATVLAGAVVLFGCAGGPLSGDLPGQTDSGAIIGEVASSRERARIHTELAGAYFQRGNLGVALAEARTAAAADSGYAPAYNVLGLVYSDLREKDLAEEAFERSLRLNPNDPDTKLFLGKVIKDANVSQAVVFRIVQKLVTLRKKGLLLHFRACNFNAFIAGHYKRAFGARLITFHGTRLLFVRIRPQQFQPGHTVEGELATHPSDATRRFRGFHDPMGEFSSMLIGILDKDGATLVESFTLIGKRIPGDIQFWAKELLRRWKSSETLEFVLPVMWDNGETTFHCPLEIGWGAKLRFV